MSFDPTKNDPNMLVPPTLWIELKCKRPDPTAIVSGREQLVVHRPRVPYQTIYEADRWLFMPLTDADPPWVVIGGFTPGTYVLEGYTAPEGGESIFMWDLNTERWVPGETIMQGRLEAPRG